MSLYPLCFNAIRLIIVFILAFCENAKFTKRQLTAEGAAGAEMVFKQIYSKNYRLLAFKGNGMS